MKFFLDIDGVMVHANPHKRVELDEDGFYKFNQTAVDVLNSVIDPEDELILSTSHRFRYDVLGWKNILQRRGIHAHNISILDLPNDSTNNRKFIIITWINKFKLPLEDIIIIDDDKSLNDLPIPLKKRLVLTNSYTGLNSSSDLNRILEIMESTFSKKSRFMDITKLYK